jgi:hypothetical protein
MQLLPEIKLAENPDRIVMLTDLGVDNCEILAEQAIETAKARMPRVTGGMASTLQVLAGEGYFGIYFPDRRTWFLEQGTKPFTMRGLPRDRAIPMWVDDQDGSTYREEQRHSKKPVQRRRTDDGREQTLIFRRAAKNKARKQVMRDGRLISVPRSYPGAPGRIASRATTGHILTGNVGVRWRHPGIRARAFLNTSMGDVALDHGIEPAPVYLFDTTSFFHLIEG